MSGSRSVENVVEVLVPRLQDAVAAEVRNLARELAARADEERAAAEAEREASLASERGRALTERAAAISAAVAVERERAAAGVAARLLDAVRRLDAETTLGGVLDALAELAGAAAGRAALFVAAEDALRSWRLVGFDPRGGEGQGVLTATQAGVVGRAIAERRSVLAARGAGEGAPDRPPAFAALPKACAAVAVPVLVGGEPVAAVYADEGTRGRGPDGARWLPTIEILARHAGSRLEALAAERAAALARDAVPSRPPARAAAG